MSAVDRFDAQSDTTAVASRVQTDNGRTLDNTGYCLLSLDGGGVRGLSALYILQNIMNRLNYSREEAGLSPRKPCEIFDLIGGTSTGGLIAIMLGRLEMSVEECIDEYIKLMKQVFAKKENRSIVSVLGRVQPRFSAKALETAISKVLKARGIPINEKFENGTRPRCKVFVCTKFQKTNAITRLRSYRLPSASNHSPTIVEAALATSAAPTYFSPAAIEGSEFVDGALGANNPALEVEEEASDLWCEVTGEIKPLVKCFVSVGTGDPGIRSVSDKGLKHLAETLQKEATETRATNQKFLGRWREYVDQGRCFRFNVSHGLDKVKLAEYEEQGLIRDATSTYLQERGTIGEVRTCVENLRMKEYQPTPDFTRRLEEQTRSQTAQRPSLSSSRATSSEISELIGLANKHLKVSPDRITTRDLALAHHNFLKALEFLRNDPSTPPKQVSRVCQKLMDASIRLSMKARDSTERKQHADQAREYGEKALDNAVKAEDDCMVAQVEFLLSCVTAWKVYLVARSSGLDAHTYSESEGVEILLRKRLEGLKKFRNLDMEVYEAQANKYLKYLRSLE